MLKIHIHWFFSEKYVFFKKIHISSEVYLYLEKKLTR